MAPKNYVLERSWAWPVTQRSHHWAAGGWTQIRVNGKNPDLDTPLQAGDIVQLPPFVQSAPAGAGEAPRGRDAFEPDPTDVDMLRNAVLYRDADVLVLNKPRDLPTQGTRRLEGPPDALAWTDARSTGLGCCRRDPQAAPAFAGMWTACWKVRRPNAAVRQTFSRTKETHPASVPRAHVWVRHRVGLRGKPTDERPRLVHRLDKVRGHPPTWR